VSESRSRRSFLVETLSGLAGGWAALTGGSLLATQLAGCPRPVKYGGPPSDRYGGPPDVPPRTAADAGAPAAPAAPDAGAPPVTKYGGPPEPPPPTTTKYGGPPTPPPPFVTKYGGPPGG
jgi:hypothetical protein